MNNFGGLLNQSLYPSSVNQSILVGCGPQGLFKGRGKCVTEVKD